MSFLPLIILGTAFAAQVQEAPPGDAEKTVRDYFEALCQDRERITSGHLEFTLKWDVYPRNPTLTGSERSYSLWFDETRRRLDLDDVRPRDPAQALHMRYAFDGKTYRTISADRPEVLVQEFTTEFLAGKPPRLLPLEGQLDPRVVGVGDMEFGLLLHRRLDDYRKFDPKATFEARRTKLGDLDALELIIHNPKNVKTLLVPKGATLPARMTTQFGSREPGGGPPYPNQVEVESDVASWPNDRGERFAFPKTIKTRRLVNGAVEMAETLTVRVVNLNVPVPDSELTWEALQPMIGVGLVLNGKYQREENTAVKWDGERFVSVPVKP